ncbi:MAG TPA: hypothetical protein VFM83_08385 [Gaiellaceae bacterium]|nr:hypothetical protein [Gaiellaceae bacterium]
MRPATVAAEAPRAVAARSELRGQLKPDECFDVVVAGADGELEQQHQRDDFECKGNRIDRG